MNPIPTAASTASPVNVVFDFGAVLFTWQPHTLVQQHLGAHAPDVQSAHDLGRAIFGHDDWHRFDGGLLDLHEVAGRTAQRLGLPLDGLHRLLDPIGERLSPIAESVALLDSLRQGPLFRADQHTYILYPDRTLPGLLERNRMTAAQVGGLALVAALVEGGERSLFVRDEDGHIHFSGHLRNVKGVTAALEGLKRQPRYAALAEAEAAKIESLFENVFRHSEFTGRSGTFFAYEGLGSVYWHMVSKLLLAVQETAQRARNEAAAARLLEHYADIRLGLSFNKTPDAYGAFPTDPYSHTPKGQGAKQPGMTGMVKEEILTRQAELGYTVVDGALTFDFLMLNRGEFASAPATFSYLAVDGRPAQLALKAGALAYMIAQVPVILEGSGEACIQIHFADGTIRRVAGHALDAATSRRILERDGAVHHLVVEVPPNV